jgi:hypothetical protein
MSATPKRELGEIVAPYGRKIRLDEVAYDSGLTLLRLTIREGSRFTILEIDAATASEWGARMRDWAEAAPGHINKIE